VQIVFLDAASDLNALVAWAQIGATIIGLVGVLVAIVTLIATLLSQTQLARFAATSSNIWKFDELWHSDEFRSLRLAAVTFLKSRPVTGDPAPELIDIWNFFEMLGLMTHKRAIDNAVVGNKFEGKVINYWYLSENLIKARRKDKRNPSLWSEFEWLRKAMEDVQDRAKHPKLSFFFGWSFRLFICRTKPTEDALAKFMADESKLKVPSAATAAAKGGSGGGQQGSEVY
jgi:hypothetical protein